MKVYFRILFISLLAVASCERDDICDSPAVSSALVVGFYKAESPDTLKTVPSLYVWAEGKDTLYSDVMTDSIALPLNPDSEYVRYFLTDSIHRDTFDIYYSKEEVFISAACGYAYSYEIKPGTHITGQWIQSMEINDSITEHDEIHIRLYH